MSPVLDKMHHVVGLNTE